VFVFDYSQKEMSREICAQKALVSTNGSDVVLDMFKVRVDPIEADRPGVAVADRFRHVITDAIKPRKIIRKDKDMRFAELRREIHDRLNNTRGLPLEMRRKVLSIGRTRISAAVCLCLRVGVFRYGRLAPRYRTIRKDSTIGWLAALSWRCYYLCVILVHSLDYLPALQPHFLLWVPGGGVRRFCGLSDKEEPVVRRERP
jgi:hypothetical protein